MKSYFIYANCKNRISIEIMENESIKVGGKINKDSSLFDKSSFIDCFEDHTKAERAFKNYCERHPNRFVWVACLEDENKEIWSLQMLHHKQM